MTPGRPATAVEQDELSEEDDRLAARVAAQPGGGALLALRSQMIDASREALMRAGDRRSHELLVAELAVARPQDAVLTKEDTDDPRRQHAERV